jgi:hypothetical protein
MSTGESEPGASPDVDEPPVADGSGSETVAPASEPSVSSAAVPAVSEPGADQRYEPSSRQGSTNMLPQDRRRSPVERLLVRLIATCGIVGIGAAIGAIMVSSHSQGWVIGLVISIVSVILAALLWSSRML